MNLHSIKLCRPNHQFLVWFFDRCAYSPRTNTCNGLYTAEVPPIAVSCRWLLLHGVDSRRPPATRACGQLVLQQQASQLKRGTGCLPSPSQVLPPSAFTAAKTQTNKHQRLHTLIPIDEIIVALPFERDAIHLSQTLLGASAGKGAEQEVYLTIRRTPTTAANFG